MKTKSAFLKEDDKVGVYSHLQADIFTKPIGKVRQFRNVIMLLLLVKYINNT
jgi:hypothetical protein